MPRAAMPEHVGLIIRSLDDARRLLEHVPAATLGRETLLTTAHALERRVSEWAANPPTSHETATALNEALTICIAASNLRRTTDS